MSSLFGSQPPAAQPLSLFANAAKGSPFGSPAPGTAAGTGNTFGTNTTPAINTPQPNTGLGIFGAPAAAQPAAAQQPQQTSSLFNSTTQQKPLFGQTQTQQPQQQQQQTGLGSSLFGASLAQNQPPQKPAGGLFGLGGQTTQQQPQQGGGIFGGLGQTQQQQQPQQGGGIFGGLGQTQQQQQPQQGGGIFGGLGQTQQQQQQPPQQQSIFGGSIIGGQQQQQQGSSLWSPGRAVTGVHRTVPMQMAIVRDKWDHTNRSSPFRTYLYNNVGEDGAPFYQPGPQDDETSWEDALRKRPGSGYVPVLVHGFWELGKRAQRQKDFLTMMQTRLHEINNCLTDLLSRHDLKISVKVADCRRKHLVLSKRCLALAAKTQVLRNRGYAMDDAEEELKKKLAQLERSVFDPSLSGRGEEIWARMLAIREHSKRLQMELERAGSGATAQTEDGLDENTIKIAKKILDDYHAQIQHLQKELESVKKDFDEAQSSLK
ncbi:nucleoporin complex subunit 54-domain-containing protein [Aspergillus cavernicola]|uniref:Nucleoporin complex subunit 54-domain-containing protein n=1 Tax=Aspergillus cavernicola TaxID=176166 RepID=A0ABR4IKZ4_9EURO